MGKLDDIGKLILHILRFISTVRKVFLLETVRTKISGFNIFLFNPNLLKLVLENSL